MDGSTESPELEEEDHGPRHHQKPWTMSGASENPQLCSVEMSPVDHPVQYFDVG
jgi:hypothetical protein